MRSEMRYRTIKLSSWIVGLLKTAGLKLLPALIGFALARTGIFGRSGFTGGIYPFGAAFAAAVPAGSAAAAMAGVLLGFLLPGSGAETIRCAASALAVAGIKWALAELKRVRSSPVFSPAAAFVGVVLTGAVVTSSIGAAIRYELAGYLAEGAMAAAGAYFFCSAAESWRFRESRRFSPQEIYCLAASVCILCIPLCRISIFGLSPFSAVIMILALAASVRFGAAAGGAAGIALGAVLALADGRFAALGVMAVSGLAAALFSPLGGIAAAASFCIACSLGTLASGSVDIYLLIEAAAASVVYPIISKRISYIFDILEPMQAMRPSQRSDGYISRRLIEAAKGLEDASVTVCRVSEKLDRIEAPAAGIVCREATGEVCADCAISGFCWSTSRAKTQKLFDSLSEILLRDGRLTRGNTPEQLRGRCARWGEMSERINARYAEYAAREGARRRVAQVRQAVAGQLCGCGQLLSELAEESREEERQSERLSGRAADMLGEYGIPAEDVCCVRRRDGSLSVSMTLRAGEDYPEPEYDAADILSDGLETSFAEPRAVRQGDSLLVTMESRPEYTLSVGMAQHSRGGNRLCGDACEVVTGQNGGTYFLLSDGMGTGGRAAVDAAMTCDLMRRLLSAGFGESGAMELVNSAMQISSAEEALVTLDCARVDVYTGELTLIKAGAASSFVLRNGRAAEIGLDTLPLGIMRRVESDAKVISLEPGDIVIMTSDGAAAQNDGWLQEELERTHTDDMQRLARDISAMAAARCGSGEDDDITVIAFRLDVLEDGEEEYAA